MSWGTDIQSPEMIETRHPDASGRTMRRPAFMGARYDAETKSDLWRINTEREARWKYADELAWAKRYARWLALLAGAAIAWAGWVTTEWMKAGGCRL